MGPRGPLHRPPACPGDVAAGVARLGDPRGGEKGTNTEAAVFDSLLLEWQAVSAAQCAALTIGWYVPSADAVHSRESIIAKYGKNIQKWWALSVNHLCFSCHLIR